MWDICFAVWTGLQFLEQGQMAIHFSKSIRIVKLLSNLRTSPALKMLAFNKHSIRFWHLFPFYYLYKCLPFLISCRLVQQIIEAILVLDIDDPPCAIAAGALLFVLASDMSTS